MLRFLPRLVLAVVVLAASAYVIAPHLRSLDWNSMQQSLLALSWQQAVIGLVAVAVAFVGVAGQERAVVAHLALRLPRGRADRAAAAASAVSQTLGFGPVIGAFVRRRLMPELSIGQSFAISAGITLGFFTGLAVLVLASLIWMPGMAYQGLAASGLCLLLGVLLGLALWPSRGQWGIWRPNLIVMARFLGWLTLDLAALALALRCLLPVGSAVEFSSFFPTFLIALGVGVVSGSPAGLGPFEATLIAALPQIDPAGLVVGIIAFRGVAYVLPAILGALWFIAFGKGGSKAMEDPLAQYSFLPAETLRALPWAEVQLIRQGQLCLMSRRGSWLWLSGKLAHVRVMLGPLLPSEGGAADRASALDLAQDQARAEARFLCLYKVDGRMAAAARSRGFAVLPMAREAVLDVAAFTLSGPERARLRRKLSHARKAGLVISCPEAPPLVEMEAVVADWRRAHGRERGFSMGRFERTYVAGQRVIVARSAAGELLAFATFHEGQEDWALDLLRFRPGTPDGTTYAMVCAALDLARQAGAHRLSLAAVPVPTFGLTGFVAPLLRRMTRKAMGLEQFKSTFGPRWEPRYAAAPSRVALIIGATEIALAVMRPFKLTRGRARLVVHEGGGDGKIRKGRASRAA